MVISINPKEYLIDWVIRYVKNKDINSKSIKEVLLGKDGVDVFLDGKEEAIVVEPFLKDVGSVLDRLKEFKGSKSLYAYNTKENFKIVFDDWKKLSEFDRMFKIVFVNPFSQLEKKWIVFPMTQNMVGSVKGLKTLFDSVDAVSEKEIEEIIKTG